MFRIVGYSILAWTMGNFIFRLYFCHFQSATKRPSMGMCDIERCALALSIRVQRLIQYLIQGHTALSRLPGQPLIQIVWDIPMDWMPFH